MTDFRAVLFDAGDTLIRLTGSGESLLHRAGADLGATLDPAEVTAVWQRVLARSSTKEELAKGRDLSGSRHREVWTALYRTAGSEELAPGLADAVYALTVDAGSWEAFPDTAPTLAAVRDRGLRIGVLSDTGFDLRPAFSRLGLAQYLDTVMLSFEFGVCKPSTTTFLAAATDLDVAPEHILMVGDNPLTDAGAVAAGMFAFLLPAPAPTGPRGLHHVLSLLR